MSYAAKWRATAGMAVRWSDRCEDNCSRTNNSSLFCFVVVGFKTLLSRNVIKVLATFRKAHFLNLFSGEGGTPNETAVALGTAIPGTVVILILAAVFVWWDCFRPKVRKIFCIRLYAQQYLSNETTVVRYHQTFIVLHFSNLNCKSSALV